MENRLTKIYRSNCNGQIKISQISTYQQMIMAYECIPTKIWTHLLLIETEKYLFQCERIQCEREEERKDENKGWNIKTSLINVTENNLYRKYGRLVQILRKFIRKEYGLFFIKIMIYVNFRRKNKFMHQLKNETIKTPFQVFSLYLLADGT